MYWHTSYGSYDWAHPHEEQLALNIFTPGKRFQFIFHQSNKRDLDYWEQTFNDSLYTKELVEAVTECVELSWYVHEDTRQKLEEFCKWVEEWGAVWDYHQAKRRKVLAEKELAHAEFMEEEALENIPVWTNGRKIDTILDIRTYNDWYLQPMQGPRQADYSF